MLQEGVTCLLNEHSEALVHNIRYRNDLALIREIESKCPTVVIVTEPDMMIDEILSTVSLTDLGPRIIVLNLNGNRIDIFDHAGTSGDEPAYLQSQFVVATSDDLLRLIFHA